MKPALGCLYDRAVQIALQGGQVMTSRRSSSSTPKSIVRVQGRFERWRRLPKSKTVGRSRIPEDLWRAAVEVALKHGAYRTARALRLNYAALKARLREQAGKRSVPEAAFVELVPAALSGVAECVVDLEDVRGTRMRIHLKGGLTPDLASMTRAFCGGDR